MFLVHGDEDGTGSIRAAKCASPPACLLLLLLLPRSRSFSANVFLSSLTASVSSALSKIVPTITGPQRGPAGTAAGHPDSEQGFGEEGHGGLAG